MNVEQVNRLLLQENWQPKEDLPKLKQLSSLPLQFPHTFGLKELPEEGGILFVRGARQLGKSTWLESELASSYLRYGPGSSFFLNCDEVAIRSDLRTELLKIIAYFNPDAPVKRLFIDEITAIDGWEQVLKLLADQGELQDILLVTTGSKATDIRRGSERLPGRKGKLDRTNYIFCPTPFRDFLKVSGDSFGSDGLIAYILTGGSPIAANELAERGVLPEYVIDLTRDWILGEIVRTGRQRSILLKIFEVLHLMGGSQISYTRLARDINVANNTVASGYIEHLQDLLCLAPAVQVDPVRLHRFYRKSIKLQFVNLLAAVATSPLKLRSIKDFKVSKPEEQAKYYEWLVAQELWRRESIANKEYDGELMYLRSKDNEIDFILKENLGLEVKRGQASPHEFSWLVREYPDLCVKVICSNSVKSKNVVSESFSDFLLGREGGR